MWFAENLSQNLRLQNVIGRECELSQNLDLSFHLHPLEVFKTTHAGLTTREAAFVPGLAQGLLLLVEVDSVLAAWAAGSPGCVHLDLVTLVWQTWTGTTKQIHTECHSIYTDRQHWTDYYTCCYTHTCICNCLTHWKRLSHVYNNILSASIFQWNQWVLNWK